MHATKYFMLNMSLSKKVLHCNQPLRSEEDSLISEIYIFIHEIKYSYVK